MLEQQYYALSMYKERTASSRQCVLCSNLRIDRKVVAHAESQSLRSLSWMKPPKSVHKRLDTNPFPDAYFVPWVQALDPLPESYGPDSEQWSNSFAICSIMKDENITDVREWLTYYKCAPTSHLRVCMRLCWPGADQHAFGSSPSIQIFQLGHASMKGTCRWMGVNHIFLTDNNSEGGKAMVEQLKLEFPPSFLTLQVEELEHAQMKHYAWCAEEQRDKYNWMGFFDLDEFLYVNG